MYTMKEVCDMVGMSYETLRYYCNEGLVPNVRRAKNNYRMFSEQNVNWVRSLICLKKCDMSINDMKRYMDLCYEGINSVEKRKKMLDIQKGLLLSKIAEINDSINYIDNKQQYYDDVLSGKKELKSNLIDLKKNV